MPKRLGSLYFNKGEQSLKELCKQKNLTEYETELIIRIYAKKESLPFIADTMEFKDKKEIMKYYSVRTINNIHKEAYIKLID